MNDLMREAIQSLAAEDEEYRQKRALKDMERNAEGKQLEAMFWQRYKARQLQKAGLLRSGNGGQ